MPPSHPRPGKPSESAPIPPPKDHPSPLLRLKIHDLCHRGARTFLSTSDASAVLEDAVHTVLDLLYPKPYSKTWPGTRSVTLVLSSMDGVAYTRGKELDSDHKEIHLSTNYINSIKPELLKSELTGVIVHEMVHCWQWNGCGEAPGGLIEGIADWVRLKADLAPPHWKRTSGDRWDAGYQITAWFLDWLEDMYGAGTVPRLNAMLKDVEYEEKGYWGDRCGFHRTVQELWMEYKKWLADEDQTEKVSEEETKDGRGTGVSSKSEAENMEECENGEGNGKGGNESGKSERAESEVDNGWTEVKGLESELKMVLIEESSADQN
jgi:Peptidase of plants and bacteria